MTKDEIRIKVAEACGWSHLTQFTNRITDPQGNAIFFNPMEKSRSDFIPNYPSDLNACAEFEKTLNADDEENYVEELKGLIMEGAYENEPRYLKSHLSSSDSTYRATAEQRCLAFLKVKGKL